LNAQFKPLALRRKQAAQALGIGVSKIDLLISDGTINAVKAGKCLLIPTEEIERYLASLPRAVLNMAGAKKPSSREYKPPGQKSRSTSPKETPSREG
jgi:excisionase family DNA binding protein